MEIIIKNSTMTFKSQRVAETYKVYSADYDVKGFYRSSDGTFSTSNTKWLTRDKMFIPIDATDVIVYLMNTNNFVAIVFWDSSENIISHNSYPNLTETIISIPTGAKYISFSVYSQTSDDQEYLKQYIKM